MQNSCHSDQHVKQQNGNKNHKDDEDRFRQIWVGYVVQLRVLRRKKGRVTKSINNPVQLKS
jgi:hypothetical protein